MDDPQAIWPGWRPLFWGVIIYFGLVRDPLGRWLRQGFLHQGRTAQARRRLYGWLLKLRLVSAMTLPPIDVEKLVAKPSPIGFTIRLFQPDDARYCLELYRLNAPGRFPEEVELEFAAVLEKMDDSILVIEKDARIAACGGAALNGDQGGLSYGLIHPDFQRQGLGRLLLLSRLARFQCPPIVVHIYAVAASVGYYERYGFRRYALWHSQNGDAHPVAGVSLHPENRQRIVAYLGAEGYPVLPVLGA